MTPKVGPYRITHNCLTLRGEELIHGPLRQLEWFRDVLNAAKPRDPDLAPTLRALIKMTRDCSFGPGERLLADGTPMRIIQPQKRRPADS